MEEHLIDKLTLSLQSPHSYRNNKIYLLNNCFYTCSLKKEVFQLLKSASLLQVHESCGTPDTVLVLTCFLLYSELLCFCAEILEHAILLQPACVCLGAVLLPHVLWHVSM